MTGPDIYQIVYSKKDEIAVLASRYGASHIHVFGSVARHTAGENSDIYFLVELESGWTLFDLGGFSFDLEKLLGKHVDVCTVNLLRDEVRSRILAEAVPL
ncbi:MAG: nucleotidyltransferase family protein [Methanomicrobiales archaeon]